MKNVKVINVETKEVTTAYDIGRSIHIEMLKEHIANGEDMNIDDLPPKEDSLETGLYYIENNDMYEIIE